MNRSEAAELGAFFLSVSLTWQMSKYLVEGGLVQEKKKPAYCLVLVRLRNNSQVGGAMVQKAKKLAYCLALVRLSKNS